MQHTAASSMMTRCKALPLWGERTFSVIDLESVRGLAKTHQTGLGFVHAHHFDPSKELGQPVTLWVVEKLTDRCDVTLEEVPKQLSGIYIS